MFNFRIKILLILVLMIAYFDTSETEMSKIDHKYNDKNIVGRILSNKIIEDLMASIKHGSIYLNIINSNQCFMCSPTYIMVADELKKSDIPPSNIIYVFPTMRKALQKSFLEDNFKLSFDSATVLFDDQVYQLLQMKYSDMKSSKLVCLNEDQGIYANLKYDRINYKELISYIR